MINIGILGTGNIGTDLLIKLIREPQFNIKIFSGRRLNSPGMEFAKSQNINISDLGIQYFINNPNSCEVVFDCTNARDAKNHAIIFEKQNILVIDLTPAKVGEFFIPSIQKTPNNRNVNMITCGGQASIPILHEISKNCKELSYIEIVSQISSDSAGLATRLNIDNYVETTEKAIKHFTKTKSCKVILNLNPAIPQVDMQTTMFIKASDFNFQNLVEDIYSKIKELKKYIPYYELVMPPVINNNILVLSVKVRGSGDYLPEYAGNLDIINCAAIETVKNLYE